jgi:predicted phosphate transport protein (TIGR00153 family)
MNIDKILKFFVPKDHSFYPLFEEDAKNMVRAAELFKQMLTSTDNEYHEKIHKEIKDVEHIGDDITDKMYQHLNKSFITPFDREDIHELASHIDDVVDSINGVSRRICLYKPKHLLPVYKQMADMIYEASREIELCIHCLNDAAANKDEITKACANVTAIEHKVDEYYYFAVAELFDKEKDAAELLKNNKILEILERCVDEEEDVTDTIKAILIKMA